MLEFLERVDTQLFLALNGDSLPFLDPVMLFITDGKLWMFAYIIGIFYLIWKYKRKQAPYLVVAFLLLIVLSDQFASGLMKPMVARLRPCHLPEINDLVYLVKERCGGRYGFISSHASNTFALATLVWLVFRPYVNYLWIVFIWAGLVSYSRIYVGVHYPGDIVVGALSGVFWAFLIFKGYLFLTKEKDKVMT